jgi:hypothetical protein
MSRRVEIVPSLTAAGRDEPPGRETVTATLPAEQRIFAERFVELYARLAKLIVQKGGKTP